MALYGRRRVVLGLISAGTFLLCLWAFFGQPLLGRCDDVLAQADTGSYVMLLANFSVGSRIGDPSADVDTLGARAEQHKLKHILYAAAASLAISPMREMGLSTLQAAQALNAAVVAFTALLVGALMTRIGIEWHQTVLLTALYAIAPATWIYGALPESWPLSGLMSVIVLILVTGRASPLVIGALTGLVMLNNPIAGVLALLPLLVGGYSLRDGLRNATVASSVALTVWAALLLVLAGSDPMFRPDRLVGFLREFRTSIADNTNPWSLSAVRRSVQNVLVLPFVMSQPDNNVTVWTLGTTWDFSWLGRMAIGAMLLLWLVIAAMAAKLAWRLRNWRSCTVGDRNAGRLAIGLSGYVLVTGAFYHWGSPDAMLLYSTTLTPALVVIVGLLLPARVGKFLLLGVCLACLPASLQQLQIYRSIMANGSLPSKCYAPGLSEDALYGKGVANPGSP